MTQFIIYNPSRFHKKVWFIYKCQHLKIVQSQLLKISKTHLFVADPDLELRGGGGGGSFDLLALLAILPLVISFFGHFFFLPLTPILPLPEIRHLFSLSFINRYTEST